MQRISYGFYNRSQLALPHLSPCQCIRLGSTVTRNSWVNHCLSHSIFSSAFWLLLFILLGESIFLSAQHEACNWCPWAISIRQIAINCSLNVYFALSRSQKIIFSASSYNGRKMGIISHNAQGSFTYPSSRIFLLRLFEHAICAKYSLYFNPETEHPIYVFTFSLLSNEWVSECRATICG